VFSTTDRTTCTTANQRYTPAAVERRDRHTDGRTLSRFVDPAQHVMRVVHTPLPSRDPKLIPVLGSQPAYDMSHKSGGRLSLISTRPAVTRAIFQTAGANFAAW